MCDQASCSGQWALTLLADLTRCSLHIKLSPATGKYMTGIAEKTYELKCLLSWETSQRGADYCKLARINQFGWYGLPNTLAPVGSTLEDARVYPKTKQYLKSLKAVPL